MTKILVTYATMAGSTAEVARAVGEELARAGLMVDVLPVGEVAGLDGYSAVVVGAPMIMGFHRTALGFLRRNRKALQSKPLAVFITAMSLTRTPDMTLPGVAVTVDEKLPKDPVNPARLTLRERYARLSSYLKPVLTAVSPVRVGVFGGRLVFGSLPLWAVLFVLLVIRAAPGDHRNWEAIQAWSAEVAQAFAGL